MSRKPPLTSRGVEQRSERERAVGLEPDDDAARWLDANDAPPPPATSKSLHKSKTLHRWRQSNPPKRVDAQGDDRPPICPACGVTQGMTTRGGRTVFVCLECGFSDDGVI